MHKIKVFQTIGLTLLISLIAISCGGGESSESTNVIIGQGGQVVIDTDAVKAAGGRALWINQEGLVHGFLRARREVAGASSSFKRIIILLLMLGKKEWTMIKK